MPWSEVIQKVSESTYFEPEDVKVVIDAVKSLATQEVKEGRVFYIPGLASFRVEAKETRVVATACAYGMMGTRRMGLNVEEVD